MPQGGGSSGIKPIVGYKMFGVPCASCALPMSVMWLFADHLEIWHSASSMRCRLPYVPSQVKQAELSIPDKKPDVRKLPRRYTSCHQCGVRFMTYRNDEPIAPNETRCKSCRHQEELFTHDELTKHADRIPSDTQ